MATDRHGGDADEFGDMGEHVSGSERAVDADGGNVGMADGGEECFECLA